MRITVLTGGTSSERDVALASAVQVVAALRSRGHQVSVVDTARGFIPEADEGSILRGTVGVEPPSIDQLHDLERGLLLSGLGNLAVVVGVVGIIVAEKFLRRPRGPRDGRMVVEHIAHVVDLVGDAHVAIGTDYDGFIHPPLELRDGALGYVRLVQHMLDRGYTDTRIENVLGVSFLRTWKQLRP